MQRVRDVADLNHFRHVTSMRACGSHVNRALMVPGGRLDDGFSLWYKVLVGLEMKAREAPRTNMKKWITRISHAAMMGLAWGVVWLPAGLVGGPLVAGELEPEHIGGPLYAGFICGAIFSELAGIASGRRRLDELSRVRAAASGAMSGLSGGVLPFVLGDDGSYSAGWAMTIVASSIAVGIVASRLRSGESSVPGAVTLAVVVSGLLAGVLPWILGNHNGIERFFPVAVIGSLTGLSALTASVSVLAARWLTTKNPAASASSL